MREILFRGKRLDNGEWVEGYLYKRIVHLSGFHQNVVVDAIEVSDGENPLGISHYTIDPSTIGQYTGLTDRNGGQRIFEGDILEHHVQSDIIVSRGEVFWETKNGRWALRLNTMNPCFYMHNPEAVEIIGNIHDNPELLGGGE